MLAADTPLWRVTVFNPASTLPEGIEHIELRQPCERDAVERVQAMRPGYDVLAVQRQMRLERSRP